MLLVSGGISIMLFGCEFLNSVVRLGRVVWLVLIGFRIRL